MRTTNIVSMIAEDAIHDFINGVNNGLLIPLGFLFIMLSSLFSKDKHILGIESVTKSINKI